MIDAAHQFSEIDESEAEAAALKAAIAKSRADPHEEMREWLLKFADGDFTAEPPTPRLL